jgi:hypothetical protein
LKFRRDFSGHRQQEIRVELQLTSECDGSGFAWRRFKTALNFRKIGRFDSDATGDLSQRIATGIGLGEFKAFFT